MQHLLSVMTNPHACRAVANDGHGVEAGLSNAVICDGDGCAWGFRAFAVRHVCFRHTRDSINSHRRARAGIKSLPSRRTGVVQQHARCTLWGVDDAAIGGVMSRGATAA